ncbi:alpha/beta fold hydrolase [bacterium]|nr:MAG: alpha/beta fold hydrolase [bacterium]
MAVLLMLAALLPGPASARRAGPHPPSPTPTPSATATPPPRPGQVRDTHIVSGDLWLRLRERFDATSTPAQAAVLFIHGAVLPGVPTFDRDPGDSWLRAAMNQGFDAYALDLDGYGESMPPLAASGGASLPRAVSDVAAAVAVIAASHPRGVALVGYDYGADAAALYAAAHPVAALVLVAPLLQPLDPALTDAALTAPMLRSWLGDDVGEGVAERAIGMALVGTRDVGRRDPPALLIPAGVRASLAQPPALPAAALAMPLLVVRGQLDALFGGDAARALAGACAHATVLDVPGDHRLPWEPGGMEAAERIAKFLSATGTGIH